ncbi:MAG: hypothetical protein GX565_01000 [Lentisphaerae bacterium]|nr:hypothetical protein [Lentisphaerota bacterium]
MSATTVTPAYGRDYTSMRALVSMDRRKPKELWQAEEMLVQDICGVYLDLLNGKDDGSDDLRKM